jgi:CDP-diacylglycerol--glycerol-3-phosphate 3-phosphatidyltransferase
MNLPNQLTILRFVLTMGYLALMSWGTIWAHVGGLLVFIVAAITDFLDGTIARRRNLTTNFGALMDPLADKILMTAAFIMMMELPLLWVPGWGVVLILSREFLITGLRTLAASQGVVLAAMNSGKAKTVLQITFVITFSALAIIVEMLHNINWAVQHTMASMVWYLQVSSFVCFVFITIYTVHSGISFTLANWRRLHLGDL